jgi:hypothetical protein
MRFRTKLMEENILDIFVIFKFEKCYPPIYCQITEDYDIQITNLSTV